MIEGCAGVRRSRKGAQYQWARYGWDHFGIPWLLGGGPVCDNPQESATGATTAYESIGCKW